MFASSIGPDKLVNDILIPFLIPYRLAKYSWFVVFQTFVKTILIIILGDEYGVPVPQIFQLMIRSVFYPPHMVLLAHHTGVYILTDDF